MAERQRSTFLKDGGEVYNYKFDPSAIKGGLWGFLSEGDRIARNASSDLSRTLLEETGRAGETVGRGLVAAGDALAGGFARGANGTSRFLFGENAPQFSSGASLNNYADQQTSGGRLPLAGDRQIPSGGQSLPGGPAGPQSIPGQTDYDIRQAPGGQHAYASGPPGPVSLPRTATDAAVPVGDQSAADRPQETPEERANREALEQLRGENYLFQGRNGEAPTDRITDILENGFPQDGQIGGIEGSSSGTNDPITLEEIDAALDAARNGEGFLTEAQIQEIEDNRKREVANIINAQFNRQKISLQEQNRLLIQGAEALGTNLAGGAGNIVSTTIDEVGRQIDDANQRISDLEAERNEALATNDLNAAKRTEDRINNLFARKNELERNFLSRIELVEKGKQFEKSYGIDLAKLEESRQKSLFDVIKLDQETAMEAAEFLTENFGQAGFDFLSLEEVAALEQSARLPAGSLMRRLQTIDEKKANQLDFISGTKYEQPGVFDPNTGQFYVIAEARRHAQDAQASSSLTLEEMQNAFESYLKAPNKDTFIDDLRAVDEGAALAIMLTPEMSAMRNYPSMDSQKAHAIYEYTQIANESPDGQIAKKDGEEYFSLLGFDPDDTVINDVLNLKKPSWFESFSSAFN